MNTEILTSFHSYHETAVISARFILKNQNALFAEAEHNSTMLL